LVVIERGTDIGKIGQNDVRDPERHFATVNCRIAKGSFDHRRWRQEVGLQHGEAQKEKAPRT
jgi:hypothetical protein